MIKYKVCGRRYLINDLDILCEKCRRHEYMLVVTLDIQGTKKSFMTTNNRFHISPGSDMYLHYWTEPRPPTKCLEGFMQLFEVEV